MRNKPLFRDVGNLSEDERIQNIGEAAMAGHTVGCVTDSEPGKAERYIQKLKAKFPSVTILGQFAGPVKGSVLIKFGPPAASNN